VGRHNQVHPIQIDWPPISQQKKFVATLDALSVGTQRFESIYQQKLAALEALKKSLLHQAFSGQL
jgi:type I restriction enzyme, S subunit